MLVSLGEQHILHKLLTSLELVSTFLLDFLNGNYWFEVKNRGSLFLGMQRKLSVKFFKMVMATPLAQSRVEFSRLVSWQSQEISWSMEEHLLYMNMAHVLKGIGTNYVTRDIAITMAGRRTTDVISVAKHLFPKSCWHVTWLFTAMNVRTSVMCVGRISRDHMKWHYTKRFTQRLEIIFVIFVATLPLERLILRSTVRGISSSSRLCASCVERDSIRILSWRNTVLYIQVKNPLSVTFVAKVTLTRIIWWPIRRQTTQILNRRSNVTGVKYVERLLLIRSLFYCT